MILEKELHDIKGGSAWAFLAGIGVMFTLIAGIFDGIMRPLKCN